MASCAACAPEMHQRALEIRIKVVGHDHMDVAASRVNIDLVYERKGEYDKAHAMLKDALKIQDEAEHMHAHYSHAGIGLVFLRQQNLKRAHEHCEMALKILTNIHTTGHPDMVYIHILLGLVYFAERQYSETTDQYEIERAILDEKPGETNPALSAALQLRMGELAGHQNELHAAYAKIQGALASFVEVFGPKHPDVAECHCYLAWLQYREGHVEQCREHLKQADDTGFLWTQELFVVKEFIGLGPEDWFQALHDKQEAAKVKKSPQTFFCDECVLYVFKAYTLNESVNSTVNSSSKVFCPHQAYTSCKPDRPEN
jgi:tetratricopeptide (TPR) repeat protein